MGPDELRRHDEDRGAVRSENALRALKVAAEKASLSGVGPHTLRHSAATVMIENGVPRKVVSKILGHFSVSITGDIYGHVSPDVSAQAMDALGAALGAESRAGLTCEGPKDMGRGLSALLRNGL